MKVAFIGPKQYSDGMKLIGFETFETESEKETLDLLKKLREKDYEIIFTSSDVLKKSVEGVVILPGLKKKTDSDFLNKIVKKAIGKEIKI